MRSIAANFGMLDSYKLEIAQWRIEQIKEKSPKCYDSKRCEHCECSLLESVLSDDKCKHGCYSFMHNESEWTEFKKLNDIKFN